MSPRWLVVFAAWAGVLAIGVANAAMLGGLTPKSLEAWDQSGGSGAPTVLTCDNFSLPAATGSALASRPVQLPAKCGSGTWAVNNGSWSISAGELNPGGGGATASISAGQTDVSAEATVLNANSGSRIAGVAVDHTGSTRIYLAGVLVGPSNAELRLVNGGTVTTLASSAATIIATTVVRITRNGTAVTVSVNVAADEASVVTEPPFTSRSSAVLGPASTPAR